MTTNFARASYQEIYDLNTRDQRVSFLGIHTPTGAKPRQMLDGFFSQFRKFKYKGCNVKLVPCATLPVDPLGVSFEAGSQQVDAREMVNPIIFKGCHGESMGGVLNQMYKNTGFLTGTSIDESGTSTIGTAPYNYAEQMYYAALSDKTFKKYGIQSGMDIKGLHPLVHSLAMNHPMLPNSANSVRGSMVQGNSLDSGSSPRGFGNDKVWNGDQISPTAPLIGLDPVDNQMFTNGAKSLGWLPTRSLAQYNASTTSEAGSPKEVYSYLPKLFMGLIILPPCYSVKMYFRCIITHYFEFKEFTTALVGTNYLNSDYVNHQDGPISMMALALQNEDYSLESDNMDIEPTTSGVF